MSSAKPGMDGRSGGSQFNINLASSEGFGSWSTVSSGTQGEQLGAAGRTRCLSWKGQKRKLVLGDLCLEEARKTSADVDVNLELSLCSNPCDIGAADVDSSIPTSTGEPELDLRLCLSVSPSTGVITDAPSTLAHDVISLSSHNIVPSVGICQLQFANSRVLVLDDSAASFLQQWKGKGVHGGGRWCGFLGRENITDGRADHCSTHRVGRRCDQEGCTRAARGRSSRCIRHGGGKRCRVENCTKSAEGKLALCIAHGGGRRCQFLECTKGAQGSTNFCKAHGGGKRCMIPGCGKGAEGGTPLCKAHGGGKRCSYAAGCSKSVHGGTQFCVAHGGGKRCVVPDCTRSARGRTDCCVRHGGGKRCKSEGCTKSAQGSTEFCKAHGGGKRCLWGQSTTGELPCNRIARKSGLCPTHAAAVEDRCVHGGKICDREGRVHGGSMFASLPACSSSGAAGA